MMTQPGCRHHCMPVRFGVLGIQSAVQLSCPQPSWHFLLLPPIPNMNKAIAWWSQEHELFLTLQKVKGCF